MADQKIRIRYLPEIKDEIPELYVVELLKATLNPRFDDLDILTCTRVEGWDGLRHPKDIVVTFCSKGVRDYVYNNRDLIENISDGMIMICDELDPERVEIYRRAVHDYGDHKVFTQDGVLFLITSDNFCYPVHTVNQYERIKLHDDPHFDEQYVPGSPVLSDA